MALGLASRTRLPGAGGRVAELSDVKLRLRWMRPCATVEAEPKGTHIAYLSWYFSGLERKLHDRGLCHHIPMNFGETPDLYRRFCDVDVAVLKTTPMDVAKPVDVTDLPHNIMQNDRVVSICNAAMIDLTGQACSESAGIRQISGTGGQLQFVRRPYASRGGKSFICFCFDAPARWPANKPNRCGFGHMQHHFDAADGCDVCRDGVWDRESERQVGPGSAGRRFNRHPHYREELERKAREFRLIPGTYFDRKEYRWLFGDGVDRFAAVDKAVDVADKRGHDSILTCGGNDLNVFDGGFSAGSARLP